MEDSFIYFLKTSNDRRYLQIVLNSYLIYYDVRPAYYSAGSLPDDIKDFLDFLILIDLKYIYNGSELFIVKRNISIPEDVYNFLGYFLGYQENYPVS